MVQRSLNQNSDPATGGGRAVAVHCRRGTVRDGPGYMAILWSLMESVTIV